MKSELAEEIFELIEARSNAPTPTEFEMALPEAARGAEPLVVEAPPGEE